MEMTKVFCLFVIVVALFVQSNAADSYGNPTTPSPPPSRVAGTTRSPQTTQCLTRGYKCYNVTLTCPKQCPERKPADPTAKACYTDCGPKCEATCRKRKPNCNGFGALCYDPRFVGGDGVMFYFHGKSNEDFALVSDNDLHINAHFIGTRPQGRSRDYTWVQSLAIMYGTHTLTLGANKVAKWNNNVDHLFFTFDNQAFTIPEGHLSVWNAPSTLGLTVERTSQYNSINVIIPQMLDLSISVVPITKEDDRIHNYQIPSDDCFAHLEIQFRFLNLSSNVEGVLGQTYKPDFKSPVKVGVPMPIMGGEDKYKTSSLTSADCRLCIFKKNSVSQLESFLVKSAGSLDCASKLGNGSGIVCRR
ncbi:hypothetical protein SUGI_0673250 [Cryptomeria japonica]|uniref:uncharacterized protein LOC131039785 n=1 Tax=Cryptomeria japonica TaxID=3369 RepID=UPI0024149F09|nr:uncharacterized protein LOC131039785 [Cryptomeria japonica]GLJ33468.1 hypothetical protein SUGI_0673250 [Cryptomeria japonica]